MADSIVQTIAGAVSGYQTDDLHIFKGIPYGAPTGGTNRFRLAKPPVPWTGVRETKEWGPSCAHGFGERPHPKLTDAMKKAFQVFGVGHEYDRSQSEDCLVLNVWTPNVGDSGRRPVLFRIHGGGFSGGSGSGGWYDGANLARRGNAVVVTINHRLAPLGFLYLDEIGGETYAGSGNVGITDLVLGLEWVRDNIAAFGGDPGRVMIFGESGGGGKVSALLAMPSAKGLFHSAIIQSGPMVRAKRPAEATATTEMMLKALDVSPSNLAALAEMPAQRILDAHNSVVASGKAGLTGFAPVLDGGVLPAHPIDALATGASADVPLMIGTTSHEMTMMMALEPNGFPHLDEAGMRARLGFLLGDRLDDVLRVFVSAHPNATKTELTARIISAANMRTSSIALADAKVAGGKAPVYMYMLTWESPIMSGVLGAAHGMCVPLSMDNCHTALWSDFKEGRSLAACMSQAWANFGARGNPNHDNLPRWAPYSAPRRTTMIFDDPCGAVDDPFASERVALQGIKGMLG